MSIMLNVNRLVSNNLCMINQGLRFPIFYYSEKDTPKKDRQRLKDLQKEVYDFSNELLNADLDTSSLINKLEYFIEKTNRLLATSTYKNNFHVAGFRNAIADMLMEYIP